MCVRVHGGGGRFKKKTLTTSKYNMDHDAFMADYNRGKERDKLEFEISKDSRWQVGDMYKGDRKMTLSAARSDLQRYFDLGKNVKKDWKYTNPEFNDDPKNYSPELLVSIGYEQLKLPEKKKKKSFFSRMFRRSRRRRSRSRSRRSRSRRRRSRSRRRRRSRRRSRRSRQRRRRRHY